MRRSRVVVFGLAVLAGAAVTAGTVVLTASANAAERRAAVTAAAENVGLDLVKLSDLRLSPAGDGTTTGTVSVEVTNTGDVGFATVHFDLALPGTLEIVSVRENGANITQCSGPFGGRWECRFAGLAPGQTRTFELGFIRSEGDPDPARSFTVGMGAITGDNGIHSNLDGARFAIIIDSPGGGTVEG